MKQQNRISRLLGNKETLLYVETTSDEAVELIENLTKVEMANRILGGLSLDFEQTGELIQKGRDLERSLRRQIRKTVLQPDPIRVSRHLAARIKEQIKKDEPGL